MNVQNYSFKRIRQDLMNTLINSEYYGFIVTDSHMDMFSGIYFFRALKVTERLT